MCLIGYHVGMSLLTGQVEEIRDGAELWLQAHSFMGAPARDSLADLAPSLLFKLQEDDGFALAVAGPPGSGKSTLARLLAHLLTASGKVTAVLSLDDYYLGHAQRLQLGRDLHPLLQLRGVPGTHDWDALMRTIDELRNGQISQLLLPIFNKSADDLEPRSLWRPVETRPDYLIVEGWCIGPPAQSESELAVAVNELESTKDPRATWRRYVNHCLAHYRAGLRQRVGHLWYLAVPDWNCVVDWRWQQERELSHPRLRSREETSAFLAPFERIVRHMQATSGLWADFRMEADSAHCLRVMAASGNIPDPPE